MNTMHRKVARLMVDTLRRRPIHQVTVQWCLEREKQTSICRQIPIPEVKRFIRKGYCTVQSSEIGAALIDLVTYETVCSDTLEGLCEYFEILVEGTPHLKTGDVMYSDGVLTVKLGGKYGTYVINRQSPNRQIWLSSPTSGPKRYDFIPGEGSSEGKWVYKHDGRSLHELLQEEIKAIVQKDVDFFSLPHSGSQK
ncbi:frataxin homolog, mitochondrial [Phlebotomus papatasi]|uniref:frataxin homolog, mitochondrial n=1 Tax=Phlebotomus papatasi TaxID=29031 RepID=UPI00248428DB|nr:frataxin homolog, mitochondrial [Phlebotomus papatasi]